MQKQRIDRLNSLLKEVISEVIRNDLPNRDIPDLLTITGVEITRDLHYAKVHTSLIGTPDQKKKMIESLNHMAGYIAVLASKKIVIRYFPALTFVIDESVDKQMRIDSLLKEINHEMESRPIKPSDE